MMDGLPYTLPLYPVKTESDVVYAVADAHWTEAPSTWPIPVLQMMRKARKKQPMNLKLDIYRPDREEDGTRPLLLIMHGGAYLIGNKEEKGQVEWCKHFASLGYVAVSIDYRLGFPMNREGVRAAEADATADAAEALFYLLGREDLRIDPERVFVAGTSAGGAIALQLAYDPPASMPACRILAVGNFWGYVHDLDILRRASIPILSFQSVQDPAVPYEQGYPLNAPKLIDLSYGTKAVHDKAVSLGIPAEHHPVPEKGHRLHLDRHDRLTERFYDIRDTTTAFFARILAE